MEHRLPVPPLISFVDIFQPYQKPPVLLDIATVSHMYQISQITPAEQQTEINKQILKNVNLQKLVTTLQNNQSNEEFIKLDGKCFQYNGPKKNDNYRKSYHQGDNGNFYCELCTYSCKSRTTIISHRNKKHTKDYIHKYNCLVCNQYSSDYKFDLLTHLLNIHSIRENEIKDTDVKIHENKYRNYYHNKNL